MGERVLVAARLARLFPHATLLFIIRNQNAVLSAWYIQEYVKGGHWLNLEASVRLESKKPHRSIMDDLDFCAMRL